MMDQEMDSVLAIAGATAGVMAGVVAPGVTVTAMAQDGIEAQAGAEAILPGEVAQNGVVKLHGNPAPGMTALGVILQAGAIADLAGEAVALAGETADLIREIEDLARETADLTREIEDLAREIPDLTREIEDLVSAVALTLVSALISVTADHCLLRLHLQQWRLQPHHRLRLSHNHRGNNSSKKSRRYLRLFLSSE
jgi:hypothetical protein